MKDLAADQAARGNTARITSDDLFRPQDYEACPLGTTAAMGVLRRDLEALASDYDAQTVELSGAYAMLSETTAQNAELKSEISRLRGELLAFWSNLP